MMQPQPPAPDKHALPLTAPRFPPLQPHLPFRFGGGCRAAPGRSTILPSHGAAGDCSPDAGMPAAAAAPPTPPRAVPPLPHPRALRRLLVRSGGGGAGARRRGPAVPALAAGWAAAAILGRARRRRRLSGCGDGGLPEEEKGGRLGRPAGAGGAGRGGGGGGGDGDGPDAPRGSGGERGRLVPQRNRGHEALGGADRCIPRVFLRDLAPLKICSSFRSAEALRPRGCFQDRGECSGIPQ